MNGPERQAHAKGEGESTACREKGGEEPVGRLERWTSKFRWSAHNTYLTLLCVVGMGMGMGVGWGWVGWGRVGQEGAVEG